MARSVRNPKLDTRSARARLAERREPYWHMLTAGLHLGYRRAGAHGGTWIARAYDAATRKRAYQALAAADDALDAEGERILSFAQAQAEARAWFPRALSRPERPMIPPAGPGPSATWCYATSTGSRTTASRAPSGRPVRPRRPTSCRP